ncbi:MAG: hypothetical protein EX260_12095, partial [Desulfobulbaceae bacterium]
MDLPAGAIGLLPLALVVIVFLVVRYYRQWRDNRIREKPFTQGQLDSLGAALPFFDGLTSAEQGRLKEKIKLFLAQKRFYGCAGLSIDDEIRVTIAAEACLLILNHDGEVYPGLTSILVYPTAFIVQHDEAGDDGVVSSALR